MDKWLLNQAVQWEGRENGETGVRTQMPEGACKKESFHARVVGGEAGKQSPTSMAELVGE